MAEYIERETILDAISEQRRFYLHERDGATDMEKLYLLWGSDNALTTMEDIMSDIPTADVAPVVHSRWEQCDYLEPCIHGFGTNRIKNAGMKCLNCVHVFKRDLLWTSNFCPNCGAKMDLED